MNRWLIVIQSILRNEITGENGGYMQHIKQEEWDKIPEDNKGEWKDYYNDHPEWLGKKVVMSGCITGNVNELGKLYIEDVHFVIDK